MKRSQPHRCTSICYSLNRMQASNANLGRQQAPLSRSRSQFASALRQGFYGATLPIGDTCPPREASVDGGNIPSIMIRPSVHIDPPIGAGGVRVVQSVASILKDQWQDARAPWLLGRSGLRAPVPQFPPKISWPLQEGGRASLLLGVGPHVSPASIHNI